MLSFVTVGLAQADSGATGLAPAQSPDAPVPPVNPGQQVFSNTCSACHIGGTNVIVPKKTLTQEALEKYAMDSVEAIKQQVTQGKNAMPGFGDRLTPDQIDAVAGYVLEQADAGW
ncbi:MAG: c-type cytochrome [Alkalinema sp. RU_4_3]|nr:c-type cytochrome [Alkalinema sp. RU_4_3]